jgi:hypothetical protein
MGNALAKQDQAQRLILFCSAFPIFTRLSRAKMKWLCYTQRGFSTGIFSII